MAQNGNHLGFRSGTTEVYTRLIEGQYPNYEQVIPKDNDKSAIVAKKELEAAVRRMAIVASDQTHRIRLKPVPLGTRDTRRTGLSSRIRRIVNGLSSRQEGRDRCGALPQFFPTES